MISQDKVETLAGLLVDRYIEILQDRKLELTAAQMESIRRFVEQCKIDVRSGPRVPKRALIDEIPVFDAEG